MPLHDPAKLAVFVDMDNLSVTGLETVLSRWRYRQTPVTLRRAYGGLDKLKGASAVLQRYGFHVRANHGKGTTDVLLTVDVMDALHAGLLPPVVAIASSDADFVPQAQPTPIKTLSPAKPPAPVKSPAPSNHLIQPRQRSLIWPKRVRWCRHCNLGNSTQSNSCNKLARPCVPLTLSVAPSPCTPISGSIQACFRSCPARGRHAWSSCSKYLEYCC